MVERLRELAERSYNGGRFTFTSFLSISEISEYYSIERELIYASPVLNGGCDFSERKMIRFGNEEELGYVEEFPIKLLLIEPLNSKFSDDLNHRDFLGALMNLGIERDMLGDIFVREKKAYVFCHETMSAYIIQNLSRIKHTSVKVCEKSDDLEQMTPVLKEKMIQVVSERADAVISKIWNLSRNESLELFVAGKIYINGRNCTENARILKPGDVISVRGYGKAEFSELCGLSKKGKKGCKVMIYC